MEFVGIDKFSLLDYEDKISCVLFCKPCNFRCPFCHNGLTVLQADTFIPFSDILDYLSSRKGLIDAVVVSGGEPTLMDDLKEKITKLKELIEDDKANALLERPINEERNIMKHNKKEREQDNILDLLYAGGNHIKRTSLDRGI